MLKIGFTNKYFTLWSVSEPYLIYVNEFQAYDKIDYTYIQNLSTDETKAKAKAIEMGIANTEVDYDLKGQNSWTWSSELKFKGEEWQFSFGKLLGEDIRNCNDTWQLERISNNKYAAARLIELGYIEMRDEYDLTVVVTKERAEIIKENIAFKNQKNVELQSAIELIKTGVIEFVPEKNINEKMRLNFFGIDLDFSEIELKEMNYRGFFYFLPIEKGKGRIIKNKKIRLTVSEIEKYKDTEGMYVVVTSWHFI